MSRIRVVMADDSAFLRQAVARMLEGQAGVVLAGQAATGEELLDRLDRWRPDVIILDLSMPGLGGLATLDAVMARRPTPVLILSTHSRRDAPLTIEALHRGALDFIDKQQYSLVDFERLRAALLDKIFQLARAPREGRADAAAALPAPSTARQPEGALPAARTARQPEQALPAVAPPLPAPGEGPEGVVSGALPGAQAGPAVPAVPGVPAGVVTARPGVRGGAVGAGAGAGAAGAGAGVWAGAGAAGAEAGAGAGAGAGGGAPGAAAAGAAVAAVGVPEVVLLGASTGGPPAVESILRQLGGRPPAPIVVAQHMPAGFTSSFAQRLNACLPLPVREAADGELLAAGTVYVAPGGTHLRLARTAAGLRAVLARQPEDSAHHPSIDLLFASAVAAVGERAVAVVLTGMGHDGAAGLAALARAGAHTIAQDETTSAVYGMPRAALATGGVREVLPLGAMAARLRQLLGMDTDGEEGED